MSKNILEFFLNIIFLHIKSIACTKKSQNWSKVHHLLLSISLIYSVYDLSDRYSNSNLTAAHAEVHILVIFVRFDSYKKKCCNRSNHDRR